MEKALAALVALQALTMGRLRLAVMVQHKMGVLFMVLVDQVVTT